MNNQNEQTNPYYCPNCRGNRASFTMLYRMAQEVTKDARSGNVVNANEETSFDMGPDGAPHVEVRCRSCGFEGPEGLFTAAAKQNPITF